MNLNKLYKKFLSYERDIVSVRDKKYIINYLNSINEIESLEDAKKFLYLLNLARSAQTEMNGDQMMDSITTTLSGNDEGAYSNTNSYINDRFIYELVQNVDDCSYIDVSDCKLNINFDLKEDIITLEYNEVGFKPKNVVAISAIGNSTKNHKKSSDLREDNLDRKDFQEIGEKGIGFKSIFGLAKRVTIQSGFFYFSFDRNEVMVPIIEDYTNYKKFDGTKLVLHIDKGRTKELYDSLKDKYSNNEAIVNDNPILFLNKLTELKYTAGDIYFGFRVTRDKAYSRKGQPVEIEYISSNKTEERIIECIRFTKEITYTIEECQSRYGSDEDQERKYKIEIIASANMNDKIDGRIYSYFPTSQKLDAPIIIHAPFKLVSGRTNIASQNYGNNRNNLWFIKTKRETISFVHEVYEKLASLLHDKIVNFIPVDNLVKSKECPLYDLQLSKQKIIKLNLFETVNQNYLAYDKVCYIDRKFQTIEEAIEVHNILNITEELVNTIHTRNYDNYGIKCVKDVNQKLFSISLSDPLKTKACLKYLKNYDPLISNFPMDVRYYINYEQCLLYSEHEKIREYIRQNTIESVLNNNIYGIYFKGEKKHYSSGMELIKKFCEENQLNIDSKFNEYIKQCKYIQSTSELILRNCILCTNLETAIPKLYKSMGFKKGKYIFSFMESDFVEKQIIGLCDEPNNESDEEFLITIKNLRKRQKAVLGDQYKSILNLIKQSGTKPNRFFSEILQNIDDCTYEQDPEVTFTFDKNLLVIEYNEIGFSRHNVLAITAIGQSTKRLISEEKTTGEKGIGFKSIFNVSNSVEVHSGNFHFKLKEETPTIPEILSTKSFQKGTKMIFNLYNGVTDEFKDNEKVILNNCIALNKIRKLKVNDIWVEIKDDYLNRIININDTEYKFYHFIYTYQINDISILNCRYEERMADANQQIHYYVPFENMDTYHLYCTFPTKIMIHVPLIIDANLVLTTSREDILEDNSWNNYTLKQIYNGYYSLLNFMKNYDYDRMLDLIPFDEYKLFSNCPVRYRDFDRRIAELPIFKIYNSDKFISLLQGFISQPIEYFVLYNIGLFNNGKNRIHVRDGLIDIGLKTNEDFSRFFKQLNEKTYIDVCKDLYDKTIYNVIQPKYIKSQEFRENLYKTLCTDGDISYKQANALNLKQWPIIPVYNNKDTEYVPFNENIYYSKQKLKSSTYRILNEECMGIEVFNTIFSHVNETTKTIREYTQSILIDDVYNKIQLYLKQSPRECALNVLNLYKQEKELFKKCLKKRKDFNVNSLYFITRNNEVKSFSQCYLSLDDERNDILDSVIVRDDFVEFAKVTGLNEIDKINDFKDLNVSYSEEVLEKLLSVNCIRNSAAFFESLFEILDINNLVNSMDGSLFFQLFKRLGPKFQDSLQDKEYVLILTDKCIEKFALELNRFYMKYPFILYDLNRLEIRNFDNYEITNTIRNELQTRKNRPKISAAIQLIDNCKYTTLRKQRILSVRDNNGRSVLLIDKHILSDYDILEELKKFFSKYFSLELDITRDTSRYTRDYFELIEKIDYDSEMEQIATSNASYLDLENVEEVKDFMCKPLKIKNKIIGGYAKTCPLCGSPVHTELTGMRLYKTVIDDEVTIIISCPNCYENLRYCTDLEIDRDAYKDNVLSFSCSINGYKWKISNVKIRLGHKAIINCFNKK